MNDQGVGWGERHGQVMLDGGGGGGHVGLAGGGGGLGRGVGVVGRWWRGWDGRRKGWAMVDGTMSDGVRWLE